MKFLNKFYTFIIAVTFASLACAKDVVFINRLPVQLRIEVTFTDNATAQVNLESESPFNRSYPIPFPQGEDIQSLRLYNVHTSQEFMAPQDWLDALNAPGTALSLMLRVPDDEWTIRGWRGVFVGILQKDARGIVFTSQKSRFPDRESGPR